MQLQTVVEIERAPFCIGYSDNIISIGSCFADNIGNYLKECLFNIIPNPVGVMYNPVSVLNTLKMVCSATQFTTDNLVFSNGLYHSMQHHGSLSLHSAEECIKRINYISLDTNRHWQECNLLLITFGTAWIYRDKSSGKVVANCHKLPADNFTREMLSADEIANMWIEWLHKVEADKPNIKVIFTVSPIRHWKDGAHGNQLSKSTLLIAIDKIIRNTKNCDYFPAYEIVMDELRDYRFYGEDMLHPSNQAVAYIREKFCRHYMDEASLNLMQRAEKHAKSMAHIALHPESEEWQRFIAKRERCKEELIKEIKRVRNEG